MHGPFRITHIAGTGASLLPVGASAWAAARLRPRPRSPVASRPPIGRQVAVGQAFAAVRSGVPVEFHGPCGSGVSTLLRHLVATVMGHGRSGVYLRAAPVDSADDILRRIVSELYVDADVAQLDLPDLAALIGRLRPLIALDYVDLPVREVADLVDALAGCGLVIGGTRPVLGPSGQSHGLPGLTDVAALDLVERDLGRPVARREHVALRRLITALGGQPGSLRRAAALVRLGEASFDRLADEAEPDPRAVDRRATRHLSDAGRRVVAVLAAAGGMLLPADLVSAICDLDQVDQTVRDLWGRGVADNHDDRFGVPICAAANYRELVLTHLNLSYGARQLIAYLGPASTGDPLTAASAALAFARYAAERAEWPLVVDLVRAAEPALLLAGRWGQCVHLLELGSRAAHAAGDWASEALFAHEKGTIAALRNEPQAARSELQHAARLRRAIGDDSGAAASAQNLDRITATAPAAPSTAAVPAAAGSRRLRRIATAGFLTVVVVLLGVRALGQDTDSPPQGVPTPPSSAVVPSPPAPTRSPNTDRPTPSRTPSPSQSSLAPGPTISVTPQAWTFTTITAMGKKFSVHSLVGEELEVRIALTSGGDLLSVDSDDCGLLKPHGDCTVAVTLNSKATKAFTANLMVTAGGYTTTVPISVRPVVTSPPSSPSGGVD